MVLLHEVLLVVNSAWFCEEAVLDSGDVAVGGDDHPSDAGRPSPRANEVPHNAGANAIAFPRVPLTDPRIPRVCVSVQVLLEGRGAAAGRLGCCPQRDPLWPDLTVRQHLEAYAALRGMWKGDTAVRVGRYKAK